MPCLFFEVIKKQGPWILPAVRQHTGPSTSWGPGPNLDALNVTSGRELVVAGLETR